MITKPKANNNRKNKSNPITEKSKELTNAYKTIFSTEAGKLILNHLDIISGYKEDSFNPCSQTSAYLQGRQSIAIHIHKVLED